MEIKAVTVFQPGSDAQSWRIRIEYMDHETGNDVLDFFGPNSRSKAFRHAASVCSEAIPQRGPYGVTDG